MQSFFIQLMVYLGKAQNTRAGTSIFASMPLLVGLGVITLAAVVAYSGKGVTGWLHPSVPKVLPAPAQTAVAPAPPVAAASGQLPVDSVADRPTTQADMMRELFKKYAAYFVGEISGSDGLRYLIAFFDKDDTMIYSVDSNELSTQGLTVLRLGDCMLSVLSAKSRINQFVLCRPSSHEITEKRFSESVAQQL